MMSCDALALDVGDEADAAGVVLGGRAVEPLLLGRAASSRMARTASAARLVRLGSFHGGAVASMSVLIVFDHREPRLLPSATNAVVLSRRSTPA